MFKEAIAGILAVTITTAAGASAPITSAQAKGMSTYQLAHQLLPPELAPRVSSHKFIADPLLAGWPLSAIQFFAKPTAASKEVCRREVYHISLNPVSTSQQSERPSPSTPVTPGSLSKMVQIGLAQRCEALTDNEFAYRQPNTKEAGAIAALTWLAAMKEIAATSRNLPAKVTCTIEHSSGSCAAGARSVLANLPITKTFTIEGVKDGERPGWKLAVMPKGPGQLYWSTFISSSSDTTPTIDMTWKAPAPF